MTAPTGSRWLRTSFRCAVVAAAGVLIVAAGASPASAATVTGIQPVPGSVRLNDVACSTARTCVAIGGFDSGAVAVAITDGVAAPVQTINGVNELRAVDCANATTCVAVGARQAPPVPPSHRPSSQGYIVTITNGVAAPPVNLLAVRDLFEVACASATTCYALGAVTGGVTTVVTITNGIPGAITPIQVDPDDPYSLEHIACASATTCYGVGATAEQGVIVPIVNGVPGVPQRVPGSVLLGGVACPSATTCFVTGVADDFFSSVLIRITNGVAGTALVTDVGLGAIACPSRSRCEVVGHTPDGAPALVPIVNGVLGQPVPLPGDGFRAIACAGPATCIVVGEDNPNQVGAFALVYESPTDAQDCKDGGWKSFRAPTFKNQGGCVSYVNAGPKGSR